MKWKSTPALPSQSFRSDWAVAAGGVLDPLQESGFPSFSSSPPTYIQNKDDDNDEVDNETDGQNVIPPRRGENLKDKSFVMTKFTSTRTLIKSGISVTTYALAVTWPSTGLARIITIYAGCCVVRDTLSPRSLKI